MRSLLLLCLALAVLSQVSARGRHKTQRRKNFPRPQSTKHLPDFPRKGSNFPNQQRPDFPRTESPIPRERPQSFPRDRPQFLPREGPTFVPGVRPTFQQRERPQFPRERPQFSRDWARPNIPSPKDHLNGILCDTCTEIVTEVEEFLKNFNEDEIVAMFSGMCDELQLPGNLSAECKEIVKEYVPMLFEMIESLDPDTVCAELCAEREASTPSKNFRGPFGKKSQINRMFVSMKERIQKNIITRVLDRMFDDKIVCDGCKQTVQFIHDLLSNNQTLADIVSELEELCASLPEDMQGACDDYVEMIPQILITLANEYFMPDEDCQAIGLCPGDVEVEVTPTPFDPFEPLDPFVPELPEIPAAYQPVIDRGLKELPNLNKYKGKLPSKSSISNLQKRLGRSLPKLNIPNKTKFSKEKKIASSYDKKVPSIADVQDELMHEIRRPVLVSATNESSGCILCTYAVKKVAAFVKKHQDTIAETIINATTTFCKQLPAPYSTKCTDEVGPYMKKALIELGLDLYLTPAEICPYFVEDCNP